MNDEIFNKIVQFVERDRWKHKHPLTRSTRIVEDLKMDGDDAFEFMEKFVDEFNLDYSEFEFDKYFSKEGFDVIGIVSSLFKKSKDSQVAITLGDLEQAAITGKLR